MSNIDLVNMSYDIEFLEEILKILIDNGHKNDHAIKETKAKIKIAKDELKSKQLKLF